VRSLRLQPAQQAHLLAEAILSSVVQACFIASPHVPPLAQLGQ
jgi:hypothetical protein